MKQIIPFRSSFKAALEIEIPDETKERFRMWAAVEIAWKTRKAGAYLGDADLRGADLGGADLRGAYMGDADLRGANLGDADLRGAYMGGANLGGANLRDADLRDADLRGANLGDADLRGAYMGGANLGGAYLRGADLGGADLGNIPIVENLDRVMLEAVTAKPKLFDMSHWHTETPCGTAHCRAGWAVALAGEAGQALEARVGTAVAGILIYQASTPDAPIPDFYCDNADALADMRARVAADDAKAARK